MRRRVAAAVCVIALIAAGGCGNNEDTGNDDEVNIESDNGGGTTPGADGNTDGATDDQHSTVPAQLTTAEFCEIFDDEILQPAAAMLQDAVEQIESGAVSDDEATFEAGKANFLDGIDNLADVLRQTAGALTDNPDLADALQEYVGGTGQFATAMIDAISEPGWHPHNAEMPAALMDASETLDVAAERVDSHCN